MKRLGLALALAAVVALAAACGTSSGTGAGGHPPRAPQPGTVRVQGSVTMSSLDGVNWGLTRLHPGHWCSTSDGYRDIARGAEVVIADDAGHTLAITTLRHGRFDETLHCSFPFTARVPAGKRFYSIAVTHRGVVKVPESELGDVRLRLR